jgi:hypothetical protein
MRMVRAKSFQRLRHHTGELLTARDLQDDVKHEARMRGLHVRALHGVWGVSLGYEVVPAQDQKSIVVTQGMAYDCNGREIVMSTPLTVRFDHPPAASNATAWWFDLLIRYDTTLGATPTNDCSGSERNVVTEGPAWRWSYAGEAPTPFITPLGFADDVRLGEEIPLVRVRVTNLGTVTDFDMTVRRVARSLARPHIAAGQVRAGSVSIDGSPLHWRARIDTSAGGFISYTPFYFASLSEHPLLGSTSGFAGIAKSLKEKTKKELLGPFARIEGASSTGFTIDVQIATVTENALQTMPGEMQLSKGFTLPVAVNWLGIELNNGCSPPPRIPPWLSVSKELSLKILIHQ